ncbi:pyridoxamine 5'-phosphate oxidase family protein [Actinopolymorpha cephalotaxi]|uniref:Nitroimidazol reductase NimA-like FMN-containing flavoprotein (Pyridoxamine 5'-phosphate oxidase superfamily) n=1 Tax=Actinopolymorpha cephalotaxi TaxID=504797 RepID=A0ABX2SB39_9ACTN|nr:pyridoxamine 5'-phosphate oxidase family protein [Actinopolymorpha cephalotaxi]NYH86871.1 nitroimidazol reductase NimA-like FMN-containing flavoprotein (pyridoxamine 5'-phosphate oxidase superfamily) [Actinopolymorpha cephalotaxi]
MKLTPLELAECLHLLGSTQIGRFVFQDRMLLNAHPVHYVLDGASVVFRTEHGAKFRAASQRTVVVFEVDDINADTGVGWSVLVRGPAELVTQPYEIGLVAEALPRQWAYDEPTDFVRVPLDVVQGRRYNGHLQTPRGRRRQRAAAGRGPTLEWPRLTPD